MYLAVVRKIRWTVVVAVGFIAFAASPCPVRDLLVFLFQGFQLHPTLLHRTAKSLPPQLLHDPDEHDVIAHGSRKLTLDTLLAPYLQERPRFSIGPQTSSVRHVYTRYERFHTSNPLIA